MEGGGEVAVAAVVVVGGAECDEAERWRDGGEER